MAPVHDTDLSEGRWSKDEWKYLELWEKIELRLKKRKRLWVISAVIVFVLLSSIPVFIEKGPKWATLAAARKLAVELGQLKRSAGTEHRAFRIAFAEDGTLRYRVDAMDHCRGGSAGKKFVKEGTLMEKTELAKFRVLSPAQGKALGIPGLRTSFCYDTLAGSQILSDARLAGFGLIPVKDLTEKRIDRVSVIVIEGQSAKISFN